MTTTDAANAYITEMIQGFSGLPSSPRVLRLLSRFIKGGDQSLEQVAELVRIDPGLSTRLFEAGSRFCAERRHACGSIDDAINDLGFDQMEWHVSQVLQNQVLVHPVGHYGLSADEAWRWALSTALGAETIARSVGMDTDEAYLSGLVHHAGMLVIDEHLRQAQPTLAFAPRLFPREFQDAELALLGFTQTEVAARFLEARGFPRPIVEAVRHQHNPGNAGDALRQACLLHAARWLRAAVCSADHSVPSFPEQHFLSPLRLSGLRLAGLVVEVRVRLGEIRNALDLMDGVDRNRAHA